ncbi:MAG: hypothetical protein HPZ91_00635 [Lentisphaeria bacterium]|nr:hypothetical protein [Lentisphaeria bacterium]
MSFADLCQSIWAMLVDFINSFVAFVFELVDGIMVPVADSLPQLDYDASFVVEVCGLANKFVALDYGGYLFMAYCLFCFSVLLVKWILGLIPGEN